MTEHAALPAPPPPARADAVSPDALPAVDRLGSRPGGWTARVLTALFLLALFVPPLVTSDVYRMSIYGQCLALAILALGVDLIWGYTGLLSLGQGLYFSIGGYAMAYSLTLQYAARTAGITDRAVPPSFMRYTGLAPTHPDYVEPAALTYIAPLMNVYVALAVAVLLPALVAGLFGLVVFRLRIKGVYFSLITQALVMAFLILALNQQPLTGGVVGINEIDDLTLCGFTFRNYQQLYYLIAGVLVVCFLGCALLVNGKVGKILTAIRDNENRVLALGYNTTMYKVFAFALAGGLAGLAGALFVPVFGKMGPTTFLGVAFSIEIVIFVAVGGRGTLVGAVLGTILIRLAYTDIAVQAPQYWPIILGALFVGVVVFMPPGLHGLARQVGRRLARRRRESA